VSRRKFYALINKEAGILRDSSRAKTVICCHFLLLFLSVDSIPFSDAARCPLRSRPFVIHHSSNNKLRFHSDLLAASNYTFPISIYYSSIAT
jgi:hypothetical protein